MFFSTIRAFFSSFMGWNCPICGGAPFDGEDSHFCAECMRSFRFVRNPVCPSCGGELSGILQICPDCLHAGRKFPWRKAAAVFIMDGFIKDVIYRFKYRNQPELARVFGYLAAGACRSAGIHADLIVPVPLHWVRYLQRGFNQSELLSEEIGKNLKIPVRSILRRKRWTGQQAKLNRDARIQNLSGAFVISGSTNCKGRCILLVDDVMTTGSTLAEAARVLLDSGAEEVNILVLARRQRN